MLCSECGINDLMEAYYKRDQNLLAKELVDPNKRYQFAEWLLKNFSPATLDSSCYDWHSKMIALLSKEAIEHPQTLMDSSKEDQLIACLITKAEPLSKKSNIYLDYQLINQNVNGMLPSTWVVLHRRISKEKNLSIAELIFEEVKNNRMEKIKILAKQKPKDFINLFSCKDKENNSLLHYAVWHNSIEIINLMIEIAPEELKKAMLIKNKGGDSPIALAVFRNRLEMLKLMSKTAPIEFNKTLLINNNNGNSPTALAISQGLIEIVKLMADLEPERFKKSLLFQNKDGYNPIFLAASSGHIEILKLISKVALLEFKISLILKNQDGTNPTITAAYKGCLEILKLMYEIAPAEIEKSLFIQNNQGNTAIMLAAAEGHIEIVKWISELFPKTLHTVNNLGHSMLDCLKMCRSSNYKNITCLYKKSDLYEGNKELVRRRELSHGWNLSGYSWLTVYETGQIFKKIQLEGHASAQWFHILGKDINHFKEAYPKLLDDFDAKLFKEVFDIGANPIPINLESMLKRIKKGEPIIIQTGYKGHGVTLLIWGNRFVICNRGGQSRRPLEIYHFDPEKMELSDLNKIFSTGKYGTSSDYRTLFFDTLPKKLLFQQTNLDKELEALADSLTPQTVGNCSLVSLMTGIYIMRLIAEVLKVEQGFKYYQSASSDKIESFDEKSFLQEACQVGKFIDQDTLAKIKKEHEAWFKTWLSFTQLTFLEHNIKPLENIPYFKPDELLILKVLDQANSLPLDDLCKEKLQRLTEIFYNYFVTNS